MGNQLSSFGNQPANTNLETETISLDLPNDSVELNRSSSSVRDDSVSMKCDVCQYSTESKDDYEQHIRTHYFRKYYCLSCHNVYETEEEFDMHLTHIWHIKLKLEVHSCRYCFKDFVAKTNLIQHLKLHHQNDCHKENSQLRVTIEKTIRKKDVLKVQKGTQTDEYDDINNNTLSEYLK